MEEASESRFSGLKNRGESVEASLNYIAESSEKPVYYVTSCRNTPAHRTVRPAIGIDSQWTPAR
jgi:hypothetical protein